MSDVCFQPLLRRPLCERRELLRKHFQIVPGEFDFAKYSDGEATEEIQAFLEESVKDGCEGLMIKMMESDASYYEPSRRSVNWLKVNSTALAYLVLTTVSAQERLSCWRWGLPRPGRHRRLLRQRQTHERLRRVPSCMLRR